MAMKSSSSCPSFSENPSQLSSGSNGKRKMTDSQENSTFGDERQMTSSKKKKKFSKGPKFLDRNLKKRVVEYLHTVKDEPFVDIDDMTKSLQSTYPEYGRKKFKDLRRQAQQTLDFIETENKDSEEENNSLENEHEARPKRTDFSVDLDDVKEEETTVKGGLSLNESLNQLYAKTPSDDIMVIDTEGDPDLRPETDFERIKKMTKSVGENKSEKKITTTGPSKSLANFVRRSNSSADFTSSSPPKKIPLLDLTGEGKKSSATKKEAATTTPVNNNKPSSSSQSKKPARKTNFLEIPLHRPTTTFADIGGCEESVAELFKMTRHLRCPQFYDKLEISPPRGCLLHGPPGCGKTLMANAIAGELNVPMISVTGTELVSGVSGDSESKIRDLFERAKSVEAPVILFIDGIDVIAKKRENAQRDMEMRIVSQLINCMEDLGRTTTKKESPKSEEVAEEDDRMMKEEDESNQKSIGSKVFVLGATSRLETVDPALRLGDRFEREIAMGIPNEEGRLHILKVMCKDFNFEEGFDFKVLARLTPGFVGSDLRSLIKAAAGYAEDKHFKLMKRDFEGLSGKNFGEDKNAFFEWLNESPEAKNSLQGLCVTYEDFHLALKDIKPSALKEGFATVPNVTFEDIGALDDIRSELEMAICAPVNDPEIVAALGMDAPSGVLLCGPPGCGKTLLAKAVANQAGINFISVKGPEIINMYVGESERAIRQVFQRARNSSPCVIFFDEIDSICPRRSGSDSGSGSNRVVNQLLTEMDGVEGRKGVYIMGATNRVDMIDAAILRPGRLTNHFFVDLPSAQGRVDILKKLTKGGTKPKLSDDVDLEFIGLSDRCEGFTGADLGKLVLRASHYCFKEYCHLKKRNGDQKVPEATSLSVRLEHFELAFKTVKPSVSGKEKRKYELMKKQYSSGLLETDPYAENAGENQSESKANKET